MMMKELTEEMIQPYVERGLIKKKTKGEYTLYCYSQETFFSHEWDDVTKQCRGLVFRNGKQVNKPFPKIFNLNETDESSFNVVDFLIKNDEPYHLLHKVNGHLCIVDFIPETGDFLIHTKGSLDDNEMNLKDRELFYETCSQIVTILKAWGDNAPAMTFMFESITATDPHTLYEKESERYGSESLVLLGIYSKGNDDEEWLSHCPLSLKSWAKWAGIPVCDITEDVHIDEQSINEMFKEADTEGYVIWFPVKDFRVKIKTHEYWKMRFMKELTVDTIIDRFVTAGEDRLFNRYPEEIAQKCVEMITEHFKMLADLMIYDARVASRFTTDRKTIGQSNMTKMDKFLTFSYLDGNIETERLMRNKEMRKAFKDFLDYNQSLKDKMHNELIDYIEKREV